MPRGRSSSADVIHDRPDSRTHGWKRRLVDAPDGDETFMRGYECMLDLAARVPWPARSLIHNDLLNRNTLAADGQVTSVFDWGCSMYGDFVYELATIVFWSPWHPNPSSKRHAVEGAGPLRRHGSRGAELR